LTKKRLKFGEVELTTDEVIADYRIAFESRQVSIVGRREVLSGKAKFGIFGDGKEVAQVVMAHFFEKGDFRAGYYRDQTLMFALGALSFQEYFAQLYAHTDVEAEPATAGRSMNAHFATRSLNRDGSWKDLVEQYNSSADVSPTGAQMPRLVGLAYASKLYRQLEDLKHFSQFSRNGNEVAFGTIGNASCAEGIFWESLNALGVLKAPVVLSIWDDDYGISVPNEFQLSRSLYDLLGGFQCYENSGFGCDLYAVRAWNYVELIDAYSVAVHRARSDHVPAVLHVTEVTQPLGHSTSGSHERYKSPERLKWEKERDCLMKMRNWMLKENICSSSDLDTLEKESRVVVEAARVEAWERYQNPIRTEASKAEDIIMRIAKRSRHTERLNEIGQSLVSSQIALYQDIMKAVHEVLMVIRDEGVTEKEELINLRDQLNIRQIERISSHLYSESQASAVNVLEVAPEYNPDSPEINGFEILNHCFDSILESDPRVIAFGEDLGKLGGVNQAFAGLQDKYGILRVTDAGIREATIMGQAIGMAMRGLRPIAEIQYLDYLLYALQIMSDDLATLQWRTRGGQKAPVIVRTRGHRLEGIWHSGSPMSGIISLVRGMNVLVPRNMVQAAGFYNTLLASDEPGLIVEVLNGYRLKEKLPQNIGEIKIPLGVSEVIREGTDITVLTYGALCRITLEVAERLRDVGIDIEVIDVRSLLPFDIKGGILESLKKTNRILFLDEDVPGGTTAYMMQEVLENHGGYYWLDSEPRTLSARAHRPAYGTDGNYWSKPNAEEIFYMVYEIMHEVSPQKYPIFYK
jgi:pyruvate/2-oxoglutarate/acetoin dehydrogenase E1 component/TPP-dependent pyruvate/acetoin dehydrogenase alpha subunit